MPKWLSVTLKSILGGIIGIPVGGLLGIGIAWLMFSGVKTAKFGTQQDSAAMAIGFAVIGLTVLGAFSGLILGVIAGLVVSLRKKNSPQ